MDFKQIEAFINVAKYKSFSKAAEAIFLSQPTISTHINTLEGELKTKLLDRSGKEIMLTPAGEIFYNYALDMINTRNHAVQAITEFYGRIEGDLKLACSTTPCKYILPQVIKDFSNKYPSVCFKITETNSAEVVSGILNFDFEIGIAGKLIPDERLQYYDFADDNLVAVTPYSRKYRDVQNNSLYFKDIMHECFIFREKSSATQQIFESALQSAGYSINKLKVISEVCSIDTALQFVKNGLGIAIMSENTVKEYVDLKFVKKFNIIDLPLKRKIYMVKSKKRTLSPAAKMFEKFVISKTRTKL